jgi:hypothetical protein
MIRLLIFAVLLSAAFETGGTARTFQDGAGSQKAGETGAIELLTPTEGVDFNSYLRGVYVATKKHWVANLPASVAKGNKGINSVEFRILQDGTVPKEFMKVRTASGKTDLDEASLEGIHGAAPFGKLPKDFTGPYIELRFTFYYNLQPSRP